ncbi:MAG: hypothetical protein U0575_14015 [Phycisphaerales bacterium]
MISFSAMVALFSAVAIAKFQRPAHALTLAKGTSQPALTGDGVAVIKVAIQKVGSDVATIAWVPPTSWNHWEATAGEARKRDGVDRKPGAIAATIGDETIEGFRKGDIVVIYKLSDTPWFVGPSENGAFGTPTAGIVATGWTY